MRVAELVVERMQQFKRVAPEQLKHSTDENLLKSVASGDFPDESQEHNPAENGTFLLLALVPAEGVLGAGENGCMRSSRDSWALFPASLVIQCAALNKSLQITEKTCFLYC